MIHDTLRAALIIAVLAAGSSLLVETRQRLAAVELAARMATQPQPGRLQQFGRATLNLADAALGVVR